MVIIITVEFKKFSQEGFQVNKTCYCARKYLTSQKFLILTEFLVLKTFLYSRKSFKYGKRTSLFRYLILLTSRRQEILPFWHISHLILHRQVYYLSDWTVLSCMSTITYQNWLAMLKIVPWADQLWRYDTSSTLFP